jgi:dTDP-4-amino-4,6-dideoxygalactose transaminase
VIQFLDLTREGDEVRDAVAAAVARVIESGTYILGDEVDAFEREFAHYCSARAAVGVASGTDAITIALKALGVGQGDEVVTAANTCVPTVVGIERAGATPVLADVDLATATLDPGSVEAMLTSRTRAIVAVHLYGRCADTAALSELARARGLFLVEDAAQAHGARGVGKHGDAVAFSFYPTKNLGALGDAGAVVTNDPDVAERARMLREYGQRERGVSDDRGLNSRLDEVQAGVLRAKLAFLDGWNERRRALATIYAARLASTGAEVPDVNGHVFHLYVVRVRERDAVRRALAERGIETAVHYARAVHQHPAYAHLQVEGRLRVSERLSAEVLSLPLYPELTDAEAERVADALAATTA